MMTLTSFVFHLMRMYMQAYRYMMLTPIMLSPVGNDKSEICKNMQIHVVDNKHNIHGLIEKEKVTNICAEHNKALSA